MDKKRRSTKTTLILGIVYIVVVVLSVGGLTYAFFTASVGGNDRASSTTVETAELKLVFNGREVIEMEEALPGQEVTKTFTVENKGDVEIEYTIDIEDVLNEFQNGDLVYSLTSTNGGASANRKVLPTSEGTLETATIEPGVIQTYTITILFKETGSNQNLSQGAKFTGKLQINSSREYKYTLSTLTDRILETQEAQSDEDIDFSYTSNGCNSFDTCESETVDDASQITNGLYYTKDNTEGGETVYYYRGTVENNYVVFGTYQNEIKEIRGYWDDSLDSNDYITYNSINECNNSDVYRFNCSEVVLASEGSSMCWRIVRTVEDGSVRLRYGGTAIKNGETYICPQTGDEANIGLSQYYTSYDSRNYANYKTSSIKTVVENWYRDNMWQNGQNTGVTNLIADTPYCNDMSEPVTNYFGAYTRLNENKSPQYKCASSTYGYTVAKGDLTYPVGLLTADEIAYAGGVYDLINKNFYLNTGKSYWTMTPSDIFASTTYMFYVDPEGFMNSAYLVSHNTVVPVISLKNVATVERGTGLYNDPYVIMTE
ncbi:MAG: hypothetical protein IJB82_03555 [Bacilli bacterium]|nr:hypothetical protein [Bacilli bacterium]